MGDSTLRRLRRRDDVRLYGSYPIHAARDSRARRSQMNFGKTVPILRIFDEGKAREFYVEFLDF